MAAGCSGQSLDFSKLSQRARLSRTETVRYFEALEDTQLWATASAYDRELALHTFRTRGGLEVDFIARFHHRLWAIEAKTTARVTDRDAAPLLAAKAYLPKNARPVIVIPKGPPRRLACGVDVLALADLLSAMAAN